MTLRAHGASSLGRARTLVGHLMLALAAAGSASVASAQAPAGYPAGYQAVIDAAKKEGKVVVYTPTDSNAGRPLVREFESMYPGVKVEYNDLPWTGILPGLEAKRFDMCIAPVTATKERLKRYAFTIPIGASASMLMKRKGDTRLMKPEDMAGKIVGAQKGGIIVNNLKTYMEQAKITFQIREYQDNNQSYNDLASERIDVAASSQPNVAYAVTKRPEIFELVNPPFGPPTYLCWVARLGDDSLVNAVNAALMKMMDDGRMAAIQKKWFGTTMDLPKTLPEPVI